LAPPQADLTLAAARFRAPDVRAPDAALNKARALHGQGNLPEAEKLYRALLERNPKNFDLLCNVASIVSHRGRSEEAIVFLRRALNQEPNSARAHAMLADALRALGRYDDSIERARRALTLDPEFAEAHASLAQSLADTGRYDEAIHAQSQAIKLEPNRPHHYHGLGELMRWRADDPRLSALERLAQRSGALPLAEQSCLHFALSKAYSDSGDVEGAFRHQIRGGALKRRQISYDEAEFLSRLSHTSSIIDTEWLQQREKGGDPSTLPILIVGMPRSGSTLVEQILASHPGVQSVGESALFITALATIAENRAALASRLSRPDLVSKLGALYVDALRRAVPSNAVRIIDKTLPNFQFAGLVHAALPNARIIHTRRDSIDTCLSAFSILFFGESQPYSYDLGELGRCYSTYQRVMAHWRGVLPAGAMIEVDYEEVVADIEGQARRIIAHCGLEWDDACLSFHTSDRPVRTASHAQVRRPIYRSSVGRPRPPEHLLLPLLKALDTDPETSAESRFN
jgi:hypothetical protein